jgi:hypothetical protein
VPALRGELDGETIRAMKRFGWSLIAASLLGSAPANADGGPFGLGLVLGDPAGISGAYRLGDKMMLDAAIGLDVLGDSDFYLHVELLLSSPPLVTGSSVGLSAYAGIGGYMVDHSDPGIGARAPFGLSLDFTRVPLQLFAEIALYVALVPGVDADIGGAAGFRYFF